MRSKESLLDPRGIHAFDAELRDVDRRLTQAYNQNEILVTALQEAREQVAALKEEVDKLGAPPSTQGVYVSANKDDTVTILSKGRKVKLNLHPSLKPEMLKPGQELILKEVFFFKQKTAYEIQGE